jgi:hypothetical protein
VRRATSGLFLVLGGAYIVAGIALSSAEPLASAGKIATAILLAPLLYLVAPQLVPIFVSPLTNRARVDSMHVGVVQIET